ncbi:amidohydrolase family protein [Microtetraspora sp. AC03309]|uniref:amidohydrolase family protein n=1 Tax=Microtetraspora sp. AC03309 TaxID=2779376 RepID=UPI001E4534AE|nr:amidohydrolase family protein [Microtetraspora sp. AC03309]MCC5575215.1 amidohydrolase family protein [Microtetraspora sp. AC03309]
MTSAADGSGVRGVLLRDAELDGRTRVDVRVHDGLVTEIGSGLTRRPGEVEHDCRGGALLPGLCDHHLHLNALAALDRSVRCGPPEVTDRDGLAAALTAARPDGNGWIRGVGYVETVAGDLDAAALDHLHPHRPVRIQHRSGALWMLNTAALAAAGIGPGDRPGIERDHDGAATGRLWRADDWLRERLPPAGPPDLASVGAALTRLGITAVTDATPDLDADAVAAITAAMRGGALPQRVHLLGAPLAPPSSGPAPDDGEGRLPTAGPHKIVIADSGLPSLDDLTERIRAAHAAGRAIAAHCVTREALVILLAALGEAGVRPGDRVEHAALVPPELVPELARRGLRVVTQPGFLAHRGDDYLRDLPAYDHVDLYRCASLVRAGVPLALSSDAPYGPLDPWTVIGAAVRRRTPAGRVAGPAERLTPARALDAYLAPPDDPGGPARRVRPGLPADLVLLRVPLAAALNELASGLVRSVLIDGRFAVR